MDWITVKELVSFLAVHKDALHVYAAFAVQVAAAAVLRKPLSSWAPWMCVLMAELLNDALDITLGEEAHIKSWQLLGAGHDVLNTLLLPTVLVLLCRYAPHLFQPRLPKLKPSISDATPKPSR